VTENRDFLGVPFAEWYRGVLVHGADSVLVEVNASPRKPEFSGGGGWGGVRCGPGTSLGFGTWTKVAEIDLAEVAHTIIVRCRMVIICNEDWCRFDAPGEIGSDLRGGDGRGGARFGDSTLFAGNAKRMGTRPTKIAVNTHHVPLFLFPLPFRMSFPQPVKPAFIWGVYGTTEVVPFQSVASARGTFVRDSTNSSGHCLEAEARGGAHGAAEDELYALVLSFAGVSGSDFRIFPPSSNTYRRFASRLRN